MRRSRPMEEPAWGKPRHTRYPIQYCSSGECRTHSASRPLYIAEVRTSGRILNARDSSAVIIVGDGDCRLRHFNVLDIAEISGTILSTTRVLTAFLSALAAVSLVVGGIGIMNIMLVSVTERTREIGIGLTIGALERDVLAQFLTEAVALSLLGGTIGVVIGLVGSYLAVPRLDIPFVFDPRVVLLAFGFSGAVGVFFGFFPARKAALLDPIEALRHE